MIVPDWPVRPDIRALVTTRAEGNLATHVGDPGLALQNRARLTSSLSLPREPVWLEQVHGTDVHIASGDTLLTPRADAACSAEVGLPLVVLVADCLPILLASEYGEIAVVHAGWRGLAAGIIDKTLARIESGRITAWLGPAIGPCHYEVDAPVRDSFESQTGFTRGRDAVHWHMDLCSVAREQLQRSGVSKICGGGICTWCDQRFYSHRENGAEARFAALIWREPGPG
ncbi:MAG: peptidoglycan editing factor PgeF [Pseudomonadota bacterium]